MKKSFSLVPVSASYAVIEIENEEEHAESIAEPTEEEIQHATSEFQDLEGDVERLEFEKEMIEVRITQTVEYLEERFEDLTTELQGLVNAIEAKQEDDFFKAQKKPDDSVDEFDFEDEDSAKDVEEAIRRNLHTKQDDDEVSDIDDEDEGFSSEDAIAEQERESLKQKCRKLYHLISKATHPDRAGSSKVHYFREATKAYANSNLEWLEKIYVKVFGRPFGTQNLFDRILSLRLRKEALEAEIAQLKRSNAWQSHMLEIEEGREFAAKQFELAIRKRISELRAILEGED